MNLSQSRDFVIGTLPLTRRGMWSTGGNYHRAIQRLIDLKGDVPIASIDTNDIDQLVKSLSEDRKQSTVSAYYSATRAVFRVVHDHGYIQKNPCVINVQNKRTYTAKERVTVEQMQLMIEGTTNVRDEAILRIQKDSAGRANEIREMKKSTTIIRHYYISADDNRVWVHHNDVIPDGAQMRMIGVSEVRHPKGEGGYLKFGHEACAALIRYLNTRKRNDDDYIWLSKQSKLIGRTSFYMLYMAAGKRVGIKSCSPHKWRHGVAVHMRKNNAEFADIADLLRHKNVALTIREYGQLTEAEKVERYLDVTSGMLQQRDNIPDDLSGIFR